VIDAVGQLRRLARKAIELGRDDAIALAASGWALANLSFVIST
jgi:hypothetical protein